MSQITVTVPSVAVYGGTVPDRGAGQTEEQFANNVYPYLGYFNTTFTPQNQAVVTALNTFKTEANALANGANTDATTATTQAELADTARIAAQAAQTATEAVYDAFDDRELGSKASAPTIDNDGNALQEGAQYWNSTSKKKFIWNGTAWVDLTINPSDHGSLTGLADDDHTQYHNDTRGDARYLKLAGGSLSGALNTAKVTVASSATTSDIWTGGNLVDWTGTATTTAFPTAPQVGATRTLICAGACSFTAGANMVIDGVPSGTVTCAANDKIIVRAISTTTFNITRLKADGTAQVSSGGITLSTPVASTSGTSITFTGIPAGTKRITINLNEVSTSGSSGLIIRLGDSGGVESTGYISNMVAFSGGAVATQTNNTTGFHFWGAGGTTAQISGSIILNLENQTTNNWEALCTFSISTALNGCGFIAGNKATSGTITQVSITTINGAETFDAGEINISFE